MVGELRHDDIGDEPLGRQPALDALGTAAEHGAAHLRDDVFELGVALCELVALRDMGRTLREDQRPQGVDVVGQRCRRVRHGPHDR
jgi:hypothetical protein